MRHIHFVGIKGVGMTALALCALDMGIKVSGSDVEEVFITDKVLRRRGIRWRLNFSKENLKPLPDLVVTTGAHGGLANPEVVAAQEMKIPVLTHAQALGKMMEGKEGISICGVGGKTTTSSMIATILDFGKRKPSYAIGVGEIFPLGSSGRYDAGEEFVAEADEYANSPGIDNRPRFSFQNPRVIVVTNIEYDHPDVYSNLEATKKTFREFFLKLPDDGLLLAGADNQNNLKVLAELEETKKINIQTYGFSPLADWRVEKAYFGPGQTIFNLEHRGLVIEGIKIKVPGRYNVLNAVAAFAVGIFVGLTPQRIKDALEKFSGTKRRFEFIGEANKIKLYDDYAHHPKEIIQVLSAARQWFPQRRIVAIFQPHTYSRTKALFSEFARAFSLAKMAVITDIYASAREKDDLGISSRLLVQEASKYHPAVFFQPGEKEVLKFLRHHLRPNDLLLTIGAGNIFQWHRQILQILKEIR